MTIVILTGMTAYAQESKLRQPMLKKLRTPCGRDPHSSPRPPRCSIGPPRQEESAVVDQDFEGMEDDDRHPDPNSAGPRGGRTRQGLSLRPVPEFRLYEAQASLLGQEHFDIVGCPDRDATPEEVGVFGPDRTP